MENSAAHVNAKPSHVQENEANNNNKAREEETTTPPKTPKRRGSKTLRNLARRGSSMSLLKLRSPTHTSVEEETVSGGLYTNL